MRAKLAKEIVPVEIAYGPVRLIALRVKENHSGQLGYFKELAIDPCAVKVLQVQVIGQVVLIGKVSDLRIGKKFRFYAMAGRAPGGAKHDKIRFVLIPREAAEGFKIEIRKNDRIRRGPHDSIPAYYDHAILGERKKTIKKRSGEP